MADESSAVLGKDEHGLIDLGNVYSEQAVLSLFLRAPLELTRYRTELNAAEFADPAHRLIYAKLVEMLDSLVQSGAKRVDPPLLLSVLAGHPKIDLVKKALPKLLAAAVYPDQLSLYVAQVKRLAVRRGMLTLAHKMELMARSELPEADLIARARESLAQLDAGGGDTRPILSPQQRAEMALSLIEQHQQGSRSDMPTGYSRLDKMLGGGIARGTMTVVTAITGGFKSTFATAMARRMAMNGNKVLYLSAEMSEELLGLKDFSAAARIDVERFRTAGSLNDDEWARLMDAANAYSARNYYSWPYNGSINDMRATCALMRDTVGLDVVFVDYIQIVEKQAMSQTRYDHVSAVSSALRSMARDMNVAVIALSQMNRGVYDSPNMLPARHLLKEAGNIENDASAVLGLYWPAGVMKIPGKIVPEANRPLSFTDWEEAGALTIPVDRGELPIFTELQVLVLKSRMGVQDGMTRLGLCAPYHDVFDPYAPAEWVKTPNGDAPMPPIERAAGADVYDLDAERIAAEYFGGISVEELRASALRGYFAMDDQPEAGSKVPAAFQSSLVGNFAKSAQEAAKPSPELPQINDPMDLV